jgi:excisionase family DNA binding protein
MSDEEKPMDDLLRGLPVRQDPPDDEPPPWMKHRVLTVDEVAGILRMSRMAAYNAVWSGKIPSIKIGRCIRVPVAGLKRMLGESVAPKEDDQPLSASGEAA